MFIGLFISAITVASIVLANEQSVRQFKVKQEHLNKRLLRHTLYYIVTELHPCMRECMLLGACESINYIIRNRTCELNDEGSETVSPDDFIAENGALFADSAEFPSAMVGGCSGHKCGEKQRCYPTGRDSHICKDIKCGNPPVVEYAVVQPGGRAPGDMRSYVFTCPGEMFPGSETITCLISGTWTPLEAKCLQAYDCPSSPSDPDFSYFDLHADGVKIDASTDITFGIKGTHDACVLLQHDRSVYNNKVVEVVIGGDNNRGYVLFSTHEVREYIFTVESSNDILSTEVYRWFWISWNGGCLKVGIGDNVGSDEVLSWCELDFTISGMSIAFAWGGKGYFVF